MCFLVPRERRDLRVLELHRKYKMTERERREEAIFRGLFSLVVGTSVWIIPENVERKKPETKVHEKSRMEKVWSTNS